MCESEKELSVAARIIIDSEIPGNVHLSAMALVFGAGVRSAHSYFDLSTIIDIDNICHLGQAFAIEIVSEKCIFKTFCWS